MSKRIRLGRRKDREPLLGYNAHEELQAGFTKAGGWRLESDERDLVPDRVAQWRKDYAV